MSSFILQLANIAIKKLSQPHFAAIPHCGSEDCKLPIYEVANHWRIPYPMVQEVNGEGVVITSIITAGYSTKPFSHSPPKCGACNSSPLRSQPHLPTCNCCAINIYEL